MQSKVMKLSITCLIMVCLLTVSIDVFGQPSTTQAKNNVKSTKPATPVQYGITTGIVTTIRTNSSISLGYYGLGQVTCKSGETLTGGGYYSPQFREMLSVYRNGPSDNGNTWIVEMMYVGTHFYGPAPQFTTYGICTKIVW